MWICIFFVFKIEVGRYFNLYFVIGFVSVGVLRFVLVLKWLIENEKLGGWFWVVKRGYEVVCFGELRVKKY